MEDTLYTVRIVFHKADNTPIADIRNLSSDPYLVSTIIVPSYPHYKDDPPLQWRTPTIRSTLHPVWDSEWIISGVPASGFRLKMKVFDEDSNTKDDRLGATEIVRRGLTDNMEDLEKEYDIKKHKGSVRAYSLTYIISGLSKRISKHGTMTVSISVIGKAKDQSDRRVYTVGPHKYSVHYSPMIGHLLGTKGAKVPTEEGHKPEKRVTTFQANKLQLMGPVPKDLRHRYVGYRPFITSMFTRTGIKGRLLSYGLHQQYMSIYAYSRLTEYGVESKGEPGDMNLERRFLEMCQWGEGGRLYTYVITLDGEWRFTETGGEFAIDMLSKHSMHSDVSKEIAFSGEFFVRRITTGHSDEHAEGSDHQQQHHEHEHEHAADGHSTSAHSSSAPKSEPHRSRLKPRNPKDYELIIDNDSGTYRPKKELLPVLQKWLSSEDNLHGLGKVSAMDGFDESLKTMKAERKEEKKKIIAEGKEPRLIQATSSISSSDAGEFGRRSSISSSDMQGLAEEEMAKNKEKAKVEEKETNGEAGGKE